MPMSMWRHPDARMGSVITLVFFAWYEFSGLLSQPRLITNAQVGFQYDGILCHTLVRTFLLVAADCGVHSGTIQLPTSEPSRCIRNIPSFYPHGSGRFLRRCVCRICDGTHTWSDVDFTRTQWNRGMCQYWILACV